MLCAPISNFIAAFRESAHDKYTGSELYFGKVVEDGRVPWHYTPVWMLITTPLVYILFFLIGLFNLIKATGGPKGFYPGKRAGLIAALWLLLPLIAVALLKSTLFNGWRHMFFIYPGFLILSLAGVSSASGFISKKLHGFNYNIANTVFVFIILCSLIITTSFMIKSHPHQSVYFNNLAGGLQNAKGNFGIGYWGSELREGLEYILKNDPREKINIYAAWEPIWFNARILKTFDRNRIRYVDKEDEADYFLSNYYNHPGEYEFKEIWSRKIDGVKILTVHELKKGE